MSDLTPPPDRPLDPAARARLRAHLVETLGEAPGSARRWLVPAAAAAAVVLIAGVAGFTALRSGDATDAGGGPGGFASEPSPTASTGAPTPWTGARDCSKLADLGIEVEPVEPDAAWPEGALIVERRDLFCVLPDEDGDARACYEMRHVVDADGTEHAYMRACDAAEVPTVTASAADPAGEAGSACRPVVAEQLADPELMFDVLSSKGTTSFWVAGGDYVLCDDSGGIVTTHRMTSTKAPDQLTAKRLAFSSSVLQVERGQMIVAYVAGGRIPDGVDNLSYTWPGGDVTYADVVLDEDGNRWWRMEHTSYDGPLSDQDQNRLELGPITVTMYGAAGEHTVDLKFGRDDCAQVNHGC